MTHYPLIGRLAVKRSLIEFRDLEKAMDAIADAKDKNRAISDYLVTRELVSSLDMKRLVKAAKTMAMRQKDVKFGTIAIKKGYISKSLLEMALDEQKQELTEKKLSRLLGDILIEAGMINTRQRDDILREQNRLKEINREAVREETDRTVREPAKTMPEVSSRESFESPENYNAGPAKELPMPGGMMLVISSDAYAAFLTKTETFNDTVSVDAIREMLFEQKIIYGIVDDTLITGFIRSSGFKKKMFRVAHGIEPSPGRDASIDYFFDTDSLKIGQVNSQGAIDFKERGEIPVVEEGTVLARITPAVNKKDGKNIFGDIIAIPQPNDIQLQYDTGASLSEDGMEVIASITGQPKLSLTGYISVLDEFITSGNVDYETGHVYYQGNITVKGRVLNGFKVKGNTITAEEIDGGIIHAEGDIRITGGITDAKIYAKGNVWALFIHKSSVLCMADVIVTKEIVESTIDNSGACLLKNGKIIFSDICSKMGVYAKNIGTQRSGPNTISTGKDIFVIKDQQRIDKEIDNGKRKLEKIIKLKIDSERKNREYQEATTKFAHIQDRSQLEYNEILSRVESLDKTKHSDEISGLKEKLAGLKNTADTSEKDLNFTFDAIDRLDRRITRLDLGRAKQQETIDGLIKEKAILGTWSQDNPGIAAIEADGSIISGTKVAGKYSESIIEQTVKHAKIKELMFKHPGEEKGSGWWEMRVITQ